MSSSDFFWVLATRRKSREFFQNLATNLENFRNVEKKDDFLLIIVYIASIMISNKSFPDTIHVRDLMLSRIYAWST